ncbi:MAG: cytochrome c biogenesis protein CcsA [Planctomycetales bacterium]|nr:cytochrome c biogenesis protein CcsA [Planctomycetales bacterium]
MFSVLHRSQASRLTRLFDRWLLPLLVVGVNFMALVWVPADGEMGESQRIVYVHVAMAWLSLLALVIATLYGFAWWSRRNPRSDDAAQAAVELGWLCSSLTLVTGSMWAHEAWGTWWTWEPRLTTMFGLWCVYSATLVVRSAIRDTQQRANATAILSVLGMLDVPLIVMATRWFRGIHPVAVSMDPVMKWTLLSYVAVCSLLVARLWNTRARQLRFCRRVERRTGLASFADIIDAPPVAGRRRIPCSPVSGGQRVSSIH